MPVDWTGLVVIGFIALLQWAFRWPFIASVIGASAFSATAIFDLGAQQVNVPLLLSVAFIVWVVVRRQASLIDDFWRLGLVGVLLGMLAFQAIAVTLISPRLFAGVFTVMVVTPSNWGGTGVALGPLEPRVQNFTQSIYFLIDLMVAALALVHYRDRAFATAAIVKCLAVLVIITGCVDAIGKYTVGDPFTWLRTMSYANVGEHTLDGGFFRINGALPEASVFATVAALALAGSAAHALIGREGVFFGASSAILALLMALSTSSTAYVALAATAAAVGALVAYRLLRQSSSGADVTMLMGALATVVAVTFLVVIEHPIVARVIDLLDAVIFSKHTTFSAIERGSWAQSNWDAFSNTYMMGAGIGSSRSSGLVAAIFGQLGLPGAALLAALFVLAVASPSRPGIRDSQLGLKLFLILIPIPLLLIAPWPQLGAIWYFIAGVLILSGGREASEQAARARQVHQRSAAFSR